jgi:hypothetical protein
LKQVEFKLEDDDAQRSNEISQVGWDVLAAWLPRARTTE